jgi:crossover junction endodeoxyribonuclease RusA
MSFLFARVYGVPGAQGSKRHVGGGRMIESSKKVGPWRDAVTAAVIQAREASSAYFEDAVRLTVTFIMPRKGEPKGWTRHHTRAPDLDKLVRSTCDAITIAAAWKDDSRVVEFVAIKVTAEPGEAPGCSLSIEALPPKEKPHGKSKADKPAAGRGDGKRRGRAGRKPGPDECAVFI